MTKRILIITVLLFALVTASFATSKVVDIIAQISSEITVNLDGKMLDLKSQDGQKVNVIVYNGTTYLPVRAFSNALGLNVDWDPVKKMVLLKSNQATQNQTQGTQGTQQTQGTGTDASQPAPNKVKSGDIVFQNEKVIVKYVGTDYGDADDLEVEVKFTVQNLTKQKYHLVAVGTKINAKPVAEKDQEREDIDPLETEDVELEFAKSDLKKAGVTSIGNLEVQLRFEHKTAPFETKILNMQF